MRFMIIVKATPDSEAGVMPQEKLIAAMATFHVHEELAKAGVLLDASGLQPSSRGWRIRYRGGKRTVINGPFTETNELIAGYTLIQVKSREEALEWTCRFPNPISEDADAEIEVRQSLRAGGFRSERGDRVLSRHGDRNQVDVRGSHVSTSLHTGYRIRALSSLSSGSGQTVRRT